MLDDYKKITNDFKDLNMLKMLHIDLGARKKVIAFLRKMFCENLLNLFWVRFGQSKTGTHWIKQKHLKTKTACHKIYEKVFERKALNLKLFARSKVRYLIPKYVHVLIIYFRWNYFSPKQSFGHMKKDDFISDRDTKN